MKQFFYVLALLALNSVAVAQYNKSIAVAHRGAWKAKNIPQNSIAALQEAARIGCYATEFDVHLTKDLIPVVCHDHDFEGIPIETSTYQELLTKKLSNGEKLPTLEEYIKAGLKHKNFKLWLDIKSSKVNKARTVLIGHYSGKVIAKLKAEEIVEIIAPNYDGLVALKLAAPKARILYIGTDKEPEVLKNLGFIGVNLLYKRYASGEYSMEEARKAGLKIGSYVVDNKEEMIHQLNLGVDYITSNDPNLLLEVLKTYKRGE